MFQARPKYYDYAKLLLEYIHASRKEFFPFDGHPMLPRQLEVHVPNYSSQRCNLNCSHCQGNNIAQIMNPYDDKLLNLIEELGGRIPLIVFSGAYVEPTLNKKLIDFIIATKQTGANFGLHTNGVLLEELQRECSFAARICQYATGEDYITISLDAGSQTSYMSTKKAPRTYFYKVIDGINSLLSARQSLHKTCPNIRLTYLLNEHNSHKADITRAVKLARQLKVDSLRFSIIYAPYGTQYNDCLRHKYDYEQPFFSCVEGRISNIIAKGYCDNPHIFILPPSFQDVESCFTDHCFYGYFQITVGSDGYLYRCSATASPSFLEHRLDRLPHSVEELIDILKRNQDMSFNPLEKCKPHGARCNRAAIDVNQNFEKRYFL